MHPDLLLLLDALKTILVTTDPALLRKGEPIPEEEDRAGLRAIELFRAQRRLPEDERSLALMYPRLWWLNALIMNSNTYGTPLLTGGEPEEVLRLLETDYSWQNNGRAYWEGRKKGIGPAG
jgi:hypothetical protein